MSFIAREQVAYKDDPPVVELPLKKEEKIKDWPENLGEDIRLPPPERRKGQKDSTIDW